jgi:hypothetical protein
MKSDEMRRPVSGGMRYAPKVIDVLEAQIRFGPPSWGNKEASREITR